MLMAVFSFNAKDHPHERIVAWGDSMMAGSKVTMSVPEIISSNLDSIPYFNYAVGGSTSKNAAILQGAKPFYLNFEVDEIPASGIINAYHYNVEPYDYQSSISFRKGKLEGVPGVLRRCTSGLPPYATSHFEFERYGKGKPLKIQDSARFYFENAIKRDKDLVLIWTGRNDALNLEGRKKAIKNIEKMVQSIDTSNSNRDYYVISVCNGIADTEGQGSKIYENIKSFNNMLEQSFGSNFIDLRSYMVSRALFDLKLIATSVDSTDMKKDAIPRSLLLDHVHLNQKGTNAAGKYLSEVIKERISK